MTIPSAAAVRHFIYPLSETSGYQFGNGKAITPENLVPDALRGTLDEWGLATNFRVIEPGDWVWAYFSGKVRRVHAVGVVDGPVGYHTDWERHTIHIRWDGELTKELQARPLRYEDYLQRVQASATRASLTTTRVFEQWLQGTSRPGGRP